MQKIKGWILTWTISFCIQQSIIFQNDENKIYMNMQSIVVIIVHHNRLMKMYLKSVIKKLCH